MADSFFERLRKYYLNVADSLGGSAGAASIFRNSTDVGMSREGIYAEFLRQHLPSKCNVFFGGYLFGHNGDESGQLDLIVTTDTAPRFDFHRDKCGKSFAPVDGTLAVVSIKSKLDKKELEETLSSFGNIPMSCREQAMPISGCDIPNYDDWPLKIIYASDGIGLGAVDKYLLEYYKENPGIPPCRRPNIIHVLEKYLFLRATPELEIQVSKGKSTTLLKPQTGEYCGVDKQPDVQAFAWVLNAIQERAMASSHLQYKYKFLINRLEYSR